MEPIDVDLGDGYRLRSLRDDDVDALFAASSAEQERLRPWVPWAHELSIESTRRYHATVLAQFAAGEALPAVLEHDDAIAGAAAFHHLDPQQASAAIGYWLAAAHEGRGVMTAAVRALIAHGFGPLGLHRIELRIAPDNARSQAIAERLGFTREGVLREAEQFPDRFGDLVLYSLLAGEWAA